MNTTITFTDCTNEDLIKLGSVDAVLSANWEFEQWLMRQRKHQERSQSEDKIFLEIFDKYFSILESKSITLSDLTK